jgi:hypothetical protein
MGKPCKHGHVDGALHVPCADCRIEYLESLVKVYEETLQQIAEGGPKTARKRLAQATLAFGRYTLGASDRTVKGN